MSLLALDLGEYTGWAVQKRHDVYEHGTQSFEALKHDGDGRRFLRFRSWLHDVKYRLGMAGDPLGAVFYERVDFIPPERTGFRAVHIWGGYWATLTAWCEHHEIPYQGIPVATIKKAVTGHGHANKKAIQAELRRRGFSFGSADEADAIALLLTAAARKEAA